MSDSPAAHTEALRRRIDDARFADDGVLRAKILDAIDLSGPQRAAILVRARSWVYAVRAQRPGTNLIDGLLREHSLTSHEGIALMCLAEAALRIPNDATLDALIQDRLAGAHWSAPEEGSSLVVNASTWALILTGRLLEPTVDEAGVPTEHGLGATLRHLLARSGEPLIRQAVCHAMGLLGEQFVAGRTIDEAIERTAKRCCVRHSFDMLGEAAHTWADAERNQERYHEAIAAVGRAAAGAGPIDGPGVSIKLSALHPRFEPSQQERVDQELQPRLIELARAAADHGIGLTIDAEEAARLDLTLDLFGALCAEPGLRGWDGLGLAVQAYQRRAPAVIELIGELARHHGRRLIVRLVKGAYWDSEIKLAQQQGLPGYPVLTRKADTDLCWIACARRLFALGERVYPQLASHNAHSIAAAIELAGSGRYELQRLHGMGEALYNRVIPETGVPCRVYAPVGSHEELLPYLVRRLLENGANSSFVHGVADHNRPIDSVVTDPIDTATRLDVAPRIPLPANLYRPDRVNSGGLDLSDRAAIARLYQGMEAALPDADDIWRAQAMIGATTVPGPGGARSLTDPTNRRRRIGLVSDAGSEQIDTALATLSAAASGWDHTPADQRAQCLERAADLIEGDRDELIALCCREAGKTVPDGIAEVREAADFCRYYAARARELFAEPLALPSPTGERNLLSLHGRGVFACISPWNFPLAIFTGQVAAALAAGNAVAAKPAEQTPLIAARTTALLHRSGIPPEVLALLPGVGPSVGAPLAADPRIAGVAFTGSIETARAINRALAARDGPIVPLIAETGGQNAMVVDASALPEQVVTDVIDSAFRSAGQRCSAARVLYLQDSVAERVLAMLVGAMDELRMGDPWELETDVGPVIDAEAKDRLAAHCRRLDADARLIHACNLPDSARHGTFFAPRVYEIDRLDALDGEVFGPILHVVRWRFGELDKVVAEINASGFGLTFGVHTRIEDTARRLTAAVRAGNQYVNRNMVGAVVGVQPFGGEGLSGTGPKAGGPHYLPAFAVERVVTTNTAAAGGNPSLLADTDPDA